MDPWGSLFAHNIDKESKVWFNLLMTTNEILAGEIKSCKCGCGASVRRNFLPGHDAKLKGRLLTATRSADWWTREPAVVAMVEQGWGHFVDSVVLAQTPVRSRPNGRFVQSRHIDSFRVWEGAILDSKGFTHAHRQCPTIIGSVEWVPTPDAGFACSDCIHTHAYSDQVWGTRRLQTAMIETETEDVVAAA